MSQSKTEFVSVNIVLLSMYQRMYEAYHTFIPFFTPIAVDKTIHLSKQVFFYMLWGLLNNLGWCKIIQVVV